MSHFTAYFDESGTHQGAQVSVMAGFVGDQRQWRKFEKRTSKLFARYRVQLFHAIDVRRGDGDFAGWTVDRKLTFVDELQHIANETLLGGTTAIVRAEDYEFYSTLDWKNCRRDSKHGVLFRGCLAQVIDIVGHTPTTREPHLSVVLEDGHKNAADTARIYEWAQGKLGPRRALSGLAFENKRTCLPLAASDLLAYAAWGVEAGQKPMGTMTTPSKSDASYQWNVSRVELETA
jgi:hypothetical protein